MGFRNPPISISELTITVGIACACLHTGLLCECWDCELGSHAFEANTFQDWITFPALRCLATEVWSACSGSAVMNPAKAETKLTVVRSDTLHVSQAIKGAVTDGSHGVPQPCLNMLSWGRTPCPLSASQSPQPQSAHETSIRRTPNETLHKTSDQCSSKSAETREAWLPWQQERKETQILNLLQHPEWGPGTGNWRKCWLLCCLGLFCQLGINSLLGRWTLNWEPASITLIWGIALTANWYGGVSSLWTVSPWAGEPGLCEKSRNKSEEMYRKQHSSRFLFSLLPQLLYIWTTSLRRENLHLPSVLLVIVLPQQQQQQKPN